MNLSGKAISYWLQELKIPKENLLVVVDDLAIPFENIRIRSKGSAAGHNGLTNIEQLTGGQNYPRLRVGIGADFGKGQQVDYVLSNFTKQEFEKIPAIIEKSMDAILSFCTIGLERTMNQFNTN
jgi:PTH1 family peptidyl-tRNA hydrolase